MEFEEVNLEEEENKSENEIASDNAENVTSSSSSTSNRYITDTIKVQIIPEKKGNFIKHTAYDIRSENNNCSVERRYNDFHSLYENLLKVYEYRIIPRLPPKQFILNSFLEERRVGLQRWLMIVSQHTIISKDIMLKHFLTEYSFKLPILSSEFASFSECNSQTVKFNDMDVILNMQNAARLVLNHLLIVKRLMSDQFKRETCQAADFLEMSAALNDLMETTGDNSLKDFSENLNDISKISDKSANSGAIERLELVIDVLIGYSDACNRVMALKESGNSEKYQKFNGHRLKNILLGTAINDEDIETQKMRISFGIYCLIDEYKLVQKYLQLLPSILLKFTYQESQTFSKISMIFQKILDLESDKLN